MYKTQYGTFNGDTWEDFCQLVFKLKYQADGYQEMPAWQGDLGIEGFTRTGTVFQCYCPDAEYTEDKLYEVQRDKITTDLAKLATYQKQLKSYLKEIKIQKWVFVIPEYKKKDLVKHCQEKAEEYRRFELDILSADFDVLLYDIEFFVDEIPRVLQFRQKKLDIEPSEPKTETEIADWKSQQISLVDNAIKKHSQRIPNQAKNFDNKVNKLTQNSISDFLNGDAMLRKWAAQYQDQYEKFQKVVSQFEKRVEDKCAIADGGSNELYAEIENELSCKIKSSFPYLDESMIDRLIYRVMADWILRCPISFE